MNPLRTAIIVFDRVDVLDFGGPLEALYKAARTSDPSPAPADRLVDVSIIASTPTVTCASPLIVTPHMSIDDARGQIEAWDIVIVPGGVSDDILDLAFERDEAGAGKQIMGFLREYCQLPKSARKAGASNRVLMSICTGALFLGKLGVLAHTSATTHHLTIPRLRELCAGQGTEVLDHKRWVDGGLIDACGGADGGDKDKDIKLVTAGGISSGLDASLYLISILGDLAMANQAADIMEHQWRPGHDYNPY